MEKKILYFSVNVSNGNSEHIGTIAISSLFPNELTEKVKTACQEHFDANVEIPEIKIEDYLEGKSGTVEIKVGSENEFVDEIYICETWLY